MSRVIYTLIRSTIAIFVVVLSLFLAGVFFVVLFSRFAKKEDHNSSDFYTYQYYTVNHESDTSLTGFATVLDALGKNEYLAGEDDESNSFILSNFGATEYECSGNCYCESERRIGSNSVPLVKGLTILVASLSTFVAYEYATRDLDEKCVNNFKHSECPLESIVSEINECTPIYRSESSTSEKEEKKEVIDSEPLTKEIKPATTKEVKTDGKETEQGKQVEVVEEDGGRYLCTGRCMTRIFSDGIKQLSAMLGQRGTDLVNNVRAISLSMQQKADVFGCESHEHTLEIDWQEKRVEVLEIYRAMKVEAPEDVTPEKYFMSYDLNNHCIEISQVEIAGDMINPSSVPANTPKHLLEAMKKSFLCMGFAIPFGLRPEDLTYGGPNPTVECKKIGS